MKKVMHAAVFASLLASASAFAHPPAEAIIDPDTWAMIDQNLQDADSPHLDLDLDTMGSASASGFSPVRRSRATVSGRSLSAKKAMGSSAP